MPLRWDKYLNPFRCQLFQGIPPEFQIGHRDLAALGQFIVSLAVQFAAGLGFADAAPLFEEEGNLGAATLCADASHPQFYTALRSPFGVLWVKSCRWLAWRETDRVVVGN